MIVNDDGTANLSPRAESLIFVLHRPNPVLACPKQSGIAWPPVQTVVFNKSSWVIPSLIHTLGKTSVLKPHSTVGVNALAQRCQSTANPSGLLSATSSSGGRAARKRPMTSIGVWGAFVFAIGNGYLGAMHKLFVH
jgi:hypothetical protein